jgi:hypothetical protein
MTRYLISFDHGAMDHIPDEEGPAVGEAAHAVVQEAMDAGVCPTVAATNVERGVGMGGVGVDPAAVSIVAEEIKGSTGSDEGDDQGHSPSSG